MDNREVVGRRRHAILGGLLAGLGLVLGLGGGVSAVIRLIGVNTVFQTFPLGEDLIAGAVGGLVLGLGVGLMAASTIR